MNNFINDKSMKYFCCLLISCMFVVTSCSKKKTDLEVYGNTFIKLSDDKFMAPDDWETCILGNGEFQIQIPPYMKESSPIEVDGNLTNSYIYNYRDTTGKGEYHYGRIAIDYVFDESCPFKKAYYYISTKEQEAFWKPIVEQALKGGDVYGMKVPDGKMLNGLHYTFLDQDDGTCIYDAFYRRGGHVKGEGPVSVHMFYMMNKKEATMMTISYHDKDSVLFKDLFNVVKTFKWKMHY